MSETRPPKEYFIADVDEKVIIRIDDVIDELVKSKNSGCNYVQISLVFRFLKLTEDEVRQKNEP